MAPREGALAPRRARGIRDSDRAGCPGQGEG